ncbi:MAG: hypothetical protein ACRCWG_15840 [Sarcina sp.]
MIKKLIFITMTLTALVFMVGCGSDTSETQIDEGTTVQFFDEEIGNEQEIGEGEQDGRGRRGGQSKLDRIQQGGERGAPRFEE